MKEKFVNALIDLLKVKTLITLMTMVTACYLALDNRLEIAVFVGIVTAVITYYFGKKDGEIK